MITAATNGKITMTEGNTIQTDECSVSGNTFGNVPIIIETDVKE